MTTSAAPARVGRAAWTAGASTFLALIAHLLAGGITPQPVALVVPFVLAFALAALMGMSQHRFLRIAVVVGLSHTLFHYLFMAGSQTVTLADSAAEHLAMGHHHHVMPALVTEASPEFIAFVMVISHGFGAVVSALLMHRAEMVAQQVRDVATELMGLAGWILPTSPAWVQTRALSFSGFFTDFVYLSFDPAGMRRRRGPPRAVVAHS